MIRDTLTNILISGVVGLAAIGFVGAQQTAYAEVTSENSMLALDALMLQDDFSDNTPGLLWSVYEEDPNNCWVEEVNERLELRSTVQADESFAGYVADGWRLKPEGDFALRIDFHHGLKTPTGSWVNIGVSSSPDALDERAVTMGVGCNNNFSYYWCEKRNGISTRSSYSWRSLSDGTIYISYDAENDTLYVSDSGYGPENSWAAFTDLLQGDWNGAPLYVFFGGRAEKLQVDSGKAYLDNFYVEDGALVDVDLQEVYRFWSPSDGTHFYTMSELEKDKLLKEYADVWVYEGVAFRAYPEATDPNVSPVYRFWSAKLRSHFYTISADERDKVIAEFSDTWTYEGVAFYAFETGSEPDWARAVYRFWSEKYRTHFFTISEPERDKLLAMPSVWTYEGIAWYAGQ